MPRVIFILLLSFAGFAANAQQRIEPDGMSYFANPKPHTIIYHDTIFTGKKQFEQLFYRTHNRGLIFLLEKHQSNKVAGQLLGVAGTIAAIMGVSRITSSQNEKSLGWVLLGGGFAATITGGYLLLMGQRNLQMAVTLFNQQYHKTAFGIGVADKRAGLVYKF